MQTNNGVFIALEGADGSGKTSQFHLLAARLKAIGHDIETFDFPRHEELSSHFVRKYLNGDYGNASSISPYTASLFFALDRYEAAPKIKEALKQGKVVLSNRYVGSNMAHQGSKFTNAGEQRGFFIWEDGLEYELLGIPRPTLNVFLRIPAEVSYELIGKKSKRSYTDQTHDQHENDIDHLRRSIATYDTLCELFPKDFKAIECTSEGKLLSIADINDKIWEAIKPMLPQKPPNVSRDMVVHLDNKSYGSLQNKIEDKNTKNSVSLNSQKSVGALEIDVKKISKLAASRIQEAAGINCLITSMEWPAEDGRYNFYIPSQLPKKLLLTYKQSLERIYKLHKQICSEGGKIGPRPKLTSLLEPIIPAAALTTIKVSGDNQSILKLITQLGENPLGEVRWLAEQIQVAANKMRPEQFTTASTQSNISTIQNDVLAELALKNFRQETPDKFKEVTLAETSPKNEFALLVDALYPYSTSSRSEIVSELEKWNYEQKSKAFMASLNLRASPILEHAQYRWNIITDSFTFNKLAKTIDIGELQVQPPTPHYGYEIPEAIESTGLDELYIECFNESAKLYSILLEENYEHQAEYATLYGHKKRRQFITNAKAHKNIREKQLDYNVAKIIETMNDKISECHPLIGNALLTQESKEEKPSKLPTLPVKTPDSTKNTSTHRRRRSRKPKK